MRPPRRKAASPSNTSEGSCSSESVSEGAPAPSAAIQTAQQLAISGWLMMTLHLNPPEADMISSEIMSQHSNVFIRNMQNYNANEEPARCYYGGTDGFFDQWGIHSKCLSAGDSNIPDIIKLSLTDRVKMITNEIEKHQSNDVHDINRRMNLAYQVKSLMTGCEHEIKKWAWDSRQILIMEKIKRALTSNNPKNYINRHEFRKDLQAVTSTGGIKKIQETIRREENLQRIGIHTGTISSWLQGPKVKDSWLRSDSYWKAMSDIAARLGALSDPEVYNKNEAALEVTLALEPADIFDSLLDSSTTLQMQAVIAAIMLNTSLADKFKILHPSSDGESERKTEKSRSLPSSPWQMTGKTYQAWEAARIEWQKHGGSSGGWDTVAARIWWHQQGGSSSGWAAVGLQEFEEYWDAPVQRRENKPPTCLSKVGLSFFECIKSVIQPTAKQDEGSQQEKVGSSEALCPSSNGE